MPKLPPNANGVAELTVSEIEARKTSLEEIKSRVKLKDENGEELNWSTHWTVAQYNWDNPKNPINGDTAEMCLAYVKETV